MAALFAVTAYAGPVGLTINATFDPSLSSDDDAAIEAAIANIEADITSPNNITVSIYFNSMDSGLGESLTTQYEPSYLEYYNAYKAVATSEVQLEALQSLGAAPTPEDPGNPVNGNDNMLITSAECRNLAIASCPGAVDSANGDGLVNGNGTYDAAIGLNTSLAVPPDQETGSEYSIEAVANHEIDEVLGIGGEGSTLGNSDADGAIGDLDLYRYSAPGVRSYSTVQNDTSPYSYFSINGGDSVLSYFNQTAGADYGDWLSNLTTTSNGLPAGFSPQVQDAFGTPGSNPTLGANELTAFNVIGYEVITPEPSTLALTGLGLILCLGFARRRRRNS